MNESTSNDMTDTATNGVAGDSADSSPVTCYQPYKMDDEVTDQLHQKIGTVVEVTGNQCCVDWGMHTSWHHWAQLDDADRYYDEPDL